MADGNGTYKVAGDEIGSGKYQINVVEGKDSAKGELAAMKDQKFDSFLEAYTMGTSVEITAASGSSPAVMAKIVENFTIKELTTSSEKDQPMDLGHKYLSITPDVNTLKAIATQTSNPHKGMYKITVGTNNYYTTEDYSELVGQKVKVLYRGDDNADVYGVLPIGTVIYEGTIGGFKKANAALPDNKKLTEASTDVYGWYDFSELGKLDTFTGIKNTYAAKAIDNDGDGKVDTVIALPYTVGTITYKNATQVTVIGLGTVKIDKIDLYKDAAVGDKVIVTAKANNPKSVDKVEKATEITGAISGVKDTNTVKMDGEWYEKGATATLASTNIGSNYTLTVVNGYYIDAVVNTSVSSNIAIVLNAGTVGAFSDENVARLLMTDGSVEEVTTATLATAGDLVSYTKDNKNVYTLTPVTDPKTVGYTGIASTGTYKEKKFGTTAIADDAVVLLAYATGKENADETDFGTSGTLKDTTKVKKISGEELKTWGSTEFGVTGSSRALVSKVNGIDYVKVLFLTAGSATLPNAVGDTQYGYVVSDVEYTSVDGTVHASYKVFDGTETLDVLESGNSTAAAKGGIITYTKDKNNVLSAVSDVTSSFEAAAIMGYNEKDQAIVLRKADGTTEETQTFTNKLQKYYVDSKEVAGAQGSGVTLASQDASGAYVLNAMYLVADGNVAVLFMDVNNVLYDAAGETSATSPAPAELAKPESSVTLSVAAKDAGDVFTLATDAKAQISDIATWGADEANLLFFRFDASYGPASQDYTLTIGTTIGGDEVFTEKATGVAKGVHFFGIDVTGASLAADAEYTEDYSDGLTAGNYTYTIKGEDGLVYASGTFQIAE